MLGIPTTIPFFRWLVEQPSYAHGEYDTTWLDRLLAARNGESFSELDAASADLTAMAVALDGYLRAGATAGKREDGGRGGGWKQAARLEALR